MHDETSTHIDDAIDDAARRMMANTPRATLRVAVQTHVEGGTSRSRRSLRWHFALAAATAIVVMALAWSVLDRTATNLTPDESVARTAPSSAPSPRRGERPPPGGQLEPEAGTAPPSVVSARRPSDSGEPVLVVELLEVMPLEVQPVDVLLLSVESVDVDPIVLQQ